MISNNPSPDIAGALREAARVLRPAGPLAVHDVVAGPDMTEKVRNDVEPWTGYIAGALTRTEYQSLLIAVGLAAVEIHRTYRVHPHATSAIIRARKPLNRTTTST